MSKAVDVFRQKFEEAGKAIRAEAFPMTFDGVPCMVRELPRLYFINAGRMPEHLTRKMIALIDRNGDSAALAKPTAAETVAGETFMRQAVCAVLVVPQVVDSGPVPEGGYLYADLLDRMPRFVQAVYQWIMNDCPRPEKGEGVLGVEDLENFPDGEGRGAGAQSGDTGEGGGKGAGRTPAPRRKRTGRK